MLNGIIIPRTFFDLFKPRRYKVFYGGRGGGKSVTFADALLTLAGQKKLRILCCRELQVSITDSVHRLLADRIRHFNIDNFYTVTQKSIIGANGSEFIFKGLHHNISEIKSLEGVDIAWVEEAQKVSRESWDLLIPTIRKQGSEIWLSFNPDNPDDETWRRFVLSPPDDAIIRKVNYSDNPFFPATLEQERAYAERVLNYDDYAHIWLGEPSIISDAQIFKNRWVVEDFTAPPKTRFYWGCDWGFACLTGDTLVATDRGDIHLRDIKIGDNVLTRDGFKKVIHTQNKGIKNVYDVNFNGQHLTATGDHRIYTTDGWKRVDELKENEKICVIQSSLMVRCINAILTVNTQTTTITSSISMVKSTVKSIIEPYGKLITEKSRKGMLSIISTATHLIILLKTYFVLLRQSIAKYILHKTNDLISMQGLIAILTKIGQSVAKKLWRPLKNGTEYALNVVSRSKLLMYIKSFVARNVANIKTNVIAKKNTLVSGAVQYLQHHLTQNVNLALKNVPISYHILEEQKEVYDITVENGEYFANGVLVHNCDPNTLIRCCMLENKLYIDYEAYGVGVELDEIPQLFDTIPESRKWQIKADCARPETISHIRNKGFNIVPAPKWQGSIEDGIAILKSFEKIVIHPRCKHTIEEMRMYSYKVDRITGEVLPIIVDAFNHCIDATRYALSDYIRNKASLQINRNIGRRIAAQNWLQDPLHPHKAVFSSIA